MTIERPDWNFDNSGAPAAPSTPSTEIVVREMQTQDGPSEATKRAFADDAPAVPAKLERDAQGRLVRPDWNKAPAVHHEESPRKNWSGLPDWGLARDEQGRFLAKDDAALRAQWEKEGGYEQARDRVLATEANILALSENPQALQAHIATLPDDIVRVAADHLRLTPAGFSQVAGAQRFEQFLNALSESQFEAFGKWWRGLSRGDQDAILGAISR
jgi:hypothetical protein